MGEYVEHLGQRNALREGLGDFDTLLSVVKARKLLGCAPVYSWRDVL